MQRSNILLITTDQQRYDTIHAMGYDYMVTPNLDRLAAEGCCYPNAYSNNPVCMAARHNIITGLPARYHGFDDNYFEDDPKVIPHELPTFPQLLSDSGYATIAVGKMHFQPCRRHNGFTHMELMEEIPRHLQDDEYAQYLKENGFGDIQSIHGVRHLLYMLPQQSLVDEEHHGSAWVAQRSIHHIKENAGKRPFFIWSSFIAPHPPFDVPEEWADLYTEKALPELKKSKTPVSDLVNANRPVADYPNEKYLRRAREAYFASISFVDYNVGKIIEELKKSGEYENTLIIFTSDHGELMGDYESYQKFLPYDSSARIPFIMRYPKKIKPGSIDERLVSLDDILPTVLDVAGVTYPNPEILPGESVFEIDGNTDRGYLYIEHGHGSKRWVCLREKQYKYTYYYGGGKEELFDMKNDPDETTNLLYDNPNQAVLEIRDKLKQRLIAEEKKYGLDGYVKDDQFIQLEEFRCGFYRECNPPMFPEKEKDTVFIELEDEVKRAVEKEDIIDLQELDIEYFEKKKVLRRETLLNL
ncbi:sulfatase-like hydrolase/transferase [Mediterraneibacter sp. NSJ-55]|uniref:Sulfatase-like hydrolase/transferase n=1 Tax=Mediterraneibacter hominis TaxID=2763054 RepID=A0A923RNS7_9FIRM|nr:sulfatase-like hydrolase/transferase [Mediterraneibacter hominis]MBC5687734.1 sulfatase-like hydrolase/transferase [Mediterraneibacter hominis]